MCVADCSKQLNQNFCIIILIFIHWKVACECYGRLPCLGGVLERGGGGRRSEGWNNQLHCLLASANDMLGQLYQGAETGMWCVLSVCCCIERNICVKFLLVFVTSLLQKEQCSMRVLVWNCLSLPWMT